MCDFPKKIYERHSSGNLVLKNKDEYIEFVNIRIERLKSASEIDDRELINVELEKLYSEFHEVYEFDKKNAQYPEPGGAFKDDVEKQQWIDRNLLAYSLNDHIGMILSNYHCWLLSRGFPDIVLSRMVIDYPTVYNRAVYDYVSVITDSPAIYPFELNLDGDIHNHRILQQSMQRELLYGVNKSYLASFTLPILIERFLLDMLQQELLDDKIKDRFMLIERSQLILSVDDMIFMKKLLKKQDYMPGNKLTCMNRTYGIIREAGLINNDDEADVIRDIYRKMPLTLGSIFKNDYMKQHINPTYYDMLEALFHKDKLKLRNNIMHGANITFDPYSTNYAAIMLQLFWGVIDRSAFV